MSPAQPQEPPYRRIVAEIRARIAAGELRAGDRMPSIRQVAQRWGVAIATATKAMATLRDEGLVEPRVGSGTVVSARA
ncbi:MAG TPA: winged helix-turn-helix domain-containing protein, partial [Mycobacterium sp.]|nr:winged helix-turn-helix domain-containing protein [Mycobacterium sp.]